VRHKGELTAAGIREVVVFHSTLEELRKYESDLPFDVIPDPQKKLYREFGVEAGLRALLNPKVWWPLARAVGRSVQRLMRGGGPVPPLQPAGGGLGLPADFLISAAGTVLAAHYGEHAYDQWPVDQVLRLAEQY
jgi:AhpC/TSA antioxidant enzyme